MRNSSFIWMCLIFVISAQARTITVDDDGPADFNNIQAAIDDPNVVDGDVVIVADGTYTGTGNKNLDFGGRAITVRSENGPEVTIIDCENDGRGFYFHSGESSAARVEGLTIRNANYYDESSPGGGIYCAGCSPTITNCIISDNKAYGGAGIRIEGGGSPIITNCIIKNNINLGSGNGGGIKSGNSSPVITDCEISNNQGYAGGGIRVDGGSPSITNCTIEENASGFAGAIYAVGCSMVLSDCIIRGNTTAEHGTITCHGDNSLIQDCLITNNSSTGGGFGDSAGLCFKHGSTATMTRCMVKDNSGSSSGGIYCHFNTNPTITNCFIVGNSADWDGAILCYRGGSPAIINCTIAANSGSRSGAIYCVNQGTFISRPKVTNCIMWGNSAPAEIVFPSGELEVTYSTIQGGWPGEGNIDNDPLFMNFANHNYHLQPDSPCIDTGDPNYISGPNETDLDGNPRLVNGIIDMGAFEFQPLSPIELLLDLIDYVDELGFHKGIANSLQSKLDAAVGLLEDGNENNDAAAVNLLQGFINAVEAQHGKKILEADADVLIATAQEIIVNIKL